MSFRLGWRDGTFYLRNLVNKSFICYNCALVFFCIYLSFSLFFLYLFDYFTMYICLSLSSFACLCLSLTFNTYIFLCLYLLFPFLSLYINLSISLYIYLCLSLSHSLYLCISLFTLYIFTIFVSFSLSLPSVCILSIRTYKGGGVHIHLPDPLSNKSFTLPPPLLDLSLPLLPPSRGVIFRYLILMI